MTPKWMPPLENCVQREGESPAEFTRRIMVAAVEAYKRRLKPVAWINGPDGVIKADPSVRFSGPTTLNWRFPLVVLDGGDDDAA